MTIDSRYTGVSADIDAVKQRSDIQKQFDHVSGDLADSVKTTTGVIAGITFQCITPAADTFPITIGNPGFRNIHGVFVGKIVDNSDPTTVPSANLTLYWQTTSTNDVCIQNIVGLTDNHNYTVNMVFVGNPAQVRKTHVRGDEHGS